MNFCEHTDKIHCMKKINEKTENKRNTPITVGVVAHVDAGKTTLCETLMYNTGVIAAPGSVDDRSSNLDTGLIEKQRGITVFSKQAVLPLADRTVYLIDTPGHSDLTAETERNLPVLDYAVLVISGTSGVQAHTYTLWSLLKRYNIPVFIFVSKMDIPEADRAAVLNQLSNKLSDGCIDFTEENADTESIAMLSETAMEEYLESGSISVSTISDMIKKREIIPCFFGSGLKNSGVKEFIEALDTYTLPGEYSDNFAARVYRVNRDPKGERLTWIKLLGGRLNVKDYIEYKNPSGENVRSKINQIRFYNGLKFSQAEAAGAGDCCAVTGPEFTLPGMGIGADDSAPPQINAIIRYDLIPESGADPREVYRRILVMQEEDPMLRFSWDEKSASISVYLMGRIQKEVFCTLVKERFDLDIKIGSGSIVYKETIQSPVEGAGHYEPLRHYAEVHLLIQPLPSGSGIIADTACSEDYLDRNWQRLILTHIEEKKHLGVLTGAELTDVRITLIAGRAHQKHTEGGDFRQATYRAVRQGLMKAKSVLLEPYVSFEIEVPAAAMGRVISDLKMIDAEFGAPENGPDSVIIRGNGPASEICMYAEELPEISRGMGRLEYMFDSYKPCRKQKKIVEENNYDPEADLENTPDSVFCSHGAGFTVKWYEADNYMHLASAAGGNSGAPSAPILRYAGSADYDEKELESIMDREFGPIRRKVYSAPVKNTPTVNTSVSAVSGKYFIVDGYNLIHAMDETRQLAAENLDLARNRLMDLMYGYAEFTGIFTVIVFDAYRVKDSENRHDNRGKLSVVYTAAGESADMLIEKTANEIGRSYSVSVVTDDSMIRLSALRSGVLRLSCKEFGEEIKAVREQINAVLRSTNISAGMTTEKIWKKESL